MLDAPPAERVVHVTLPSRRGAGGTSLLETFLIIAAMRIVDARRVFEFGTFLGTNTLNMALNTPEDARIFTLDLGVDHVAEATQLSEDALLTRTHLASDAHLDFSGSSVAGKIERLFGNSVSFDFLAWKNSIDFLFIDGGHDSMTVRSDTENAFEIARKGEASCIFWHDYRKREYPGLTRYLDDLAQDREMFHIEDTNLCAWFNDPHQLILPQLMS
jgi:hypothetical protein